MRKTEERENEDERGERKGKTKRVEGTRVRRKSRRMGDCENGRKWERDDRKSGTYSYVENEE